jgi:HSP90 family molecular chaperone
MILLVLLGFWEAATSQNLMENQSDKLNNLKKETSMKKIETEFTLDKTNILPTLLKDITNQNPSRTMIYELFQNSLDALDLVSGDKKIDIVIDDKENSLSFMDNGTGMLPDEVR